MWGGNTEGQLGLGEEAQETVFTPNQLPLDDQVRRVVTVIRTLPP